jgi:hypothetical protein
MPPNLANVNPTGREIAYVAGTTNLFYMTTTSVSFNFMDKTYDADVEYFEPPGVMPYYKVNISDPQLVKQFGMIHNFKEVIKNGWVVLEPALDPQGKYHAYFWTCLMTSIYFLLLNNNDFKGTH